MNYIKSLLEISIFVCLVVLLVKNYMSESFLQASLTNILTLSIAFFITYYLREVKEGTKRLDDNVEHIVTEIEQLVRTEEMFSDNRGLALTSITACANRIGYLKKYSKKIDIPNFEENIKLINEWFTEMRDYYSPNQNERDKHATRIQKIKELIIARCIEIRLSIYTKK